MAKKQKYVSIRIPKELRDRIKIFADREDKKIGRLVVRVMNEFLNRSVG